jgi:uncharacterized protein YecE (DUF72 family)
MGRIRTGTVGYSYRDWAGIFYPVGLPPRRQLGQYCEYFNTCELTSFTHQMPDYERVRHFSLQLRGDIKIFVRLHNTFTHCADSGLALTVARHFRKAMEPLAEAGKLGGLVATFPYAFKSSEESRSYLVQLASALAFEGLSIQVDFRHRSWFAQESLDWCGQHGLGVVCVDEPALPGLVEPLSVPTSGLTMVRLHGRNSAGWWSGNAVTRYDYLYSEAELQELFARYRPLIDGPGEVVFLFQNHWQAQAVQNAYQWKQLLASAQPRMLDPIVSSSAGTDEAPLDDEALRPPTSLSLSEVKSRVSRALLDVQPSLHLPMRS